MNKKSKMSALLRFVLNKNNSDGLERYKAQAEARAHNLLGTDGKLRSDYSSLIGCMKSTVKEGNDINVVIKAATAMLPDDDATDLYKYLKTTH